MKPLTLVILFYIFNDLFCPISNPLGIFLLKLNSIAPINFPKSIYTVSLNSKIIGPRPISIFDVGKRNTARNQCVSVQLESSFWIS